MTSAARLRPDFERIRNARGETRSAERLLAHYEIESRLAAELAQSSREQRSRLYSDVYRQLFEAVPDHPQHRGDRAVRLDRIRAQAAWLSGYLGPEATYVEIGCGDAALTKAIAAGVRSAIGVDVTPVLVAGETPKAFQFLLSDGVSLDIASGTVDLVFSNQLMEHLHTDDALAQLQEIFRILKPGGRYICCTPNRLSGPHDISVYFGEQPTGFHMREYDHRSLSRVFRSVGFSSVTALVSVKGRSLHLPIGVVSLIESCFETVPARLRRWLRLKPQIANVLGLTLVGAK